MITESKALARVIRAGRFVQKYADPLLKGLAALSALAILFGAIWATVYFAFIANVMPDVAGDSIPSILVMLAAAGATFLILLLGILQYGGIWLGLVLKDDRWQSRLGTAALTFGAVTAGLVAITCLVAKQPAPNMILAWLAFGVPASLPVIQFLATKSSARRWFVFITQLMVYATSFILGLGFFLIVIVNAAPATTQHASSALIYGIAVMVVFGLLNIVTASLDVKFMPIAPLLGMLILIYFYGGTMIVVPFRMMHVGSYNAQLEVDPKILAEPIVKNCFDNDGHLIRGYITNSLGAEITLMTRNPGIPLQASPSVHSPSTTLSSPCSIEISKRDVEMIVTASSPVPKNTAPPAIRSKGKPATGK